MALFRPTTTTISTASHAYQKNSFEGTRRKRNLPGDITEQEELPIEQVLLAVSCIKNELIVMDEKTAGVWAGTSISRNLLVKVIKWRGCFPQPTYIAPN